MTGGLVVGAGVVVVCPPPPDGVVVGAGVVVAARRGEVCACAGRITDWTIGFVQVSGRAAKAPVPAVSLMSVRR